MKVMLMSEKQCLFTKHIAYLVFFANSIGIGLTFGDAFRSQFQQDEYVRTGKSRTKNSNHLVRLAVDFNFFIKDELIYDKERLQKLGDYWESLYEGINRWGGNFKEFIDTPHFEANYKK